MTMIIALDPGPAQTGYVVVRHGRVWLSGIVGNEDVLARLRRDRANNDVTLAIEMIASYGMPVGREVFETCVWIGRFIEAWGGHYQLVYRKDVKLALCGSTRAKDSNIRQALIDRVGAPGTKKAPGPTYGVKGDAWAALAVAVVAEQGALL